MKQLMPILIICHLLIFACVTNNQDVKSLSSSYDGIWEGYTNTDNGRFDIKMEIKNGKMTGYFDDTKIKGYIESDDNLFISSFIVIGASAKLETSFMSTDRIEGTLRAGQGNFKWFVVKTDTNN